MTVKFTYTPAEVQEITAKYQAGTSLDQLAIEYNKSVASIRMKLVKLGGYVAKAAVKAHTPKQQRVIADSDFATALALVGAALI